MAALLKNRQFIREAGKRKKFKEKIDKNYFRITLFDHSLDFMKDLIREVKAISRFAVGLLWVGCVISGKDPTRLVILTTNFSVNTDLKLPDNIKLS